jgi:signal transduction histidine kinase
VSRLFREAVGDAQEQRDALLEHLSLIRDLVQLGHTAESFRELCTQAAECLVGRLGCERVLVVRGRADEALDIAGAYSQAERFGDAEEACPGVLLELAREVVRARELVRWGGEGVGPRRPLPEGLTGAVVGLPLVVGDECVGAILCVQVIPVPWDLVSQRALELVAEIVGQVLTLAQMRISMAGIQRDLETELGLTHRRIDHQEATLRAQAERISRLASTLSASNQAKATFLSLMSHELRTPLSVILGFGSLLREGAVGPVNDQQTAYLDRIFSNGRHLHQLVEDMLFFVDAQTTEIRPAWSDVDLARLVEEVAESVPGACTAGAPALTVAIARDAAVVRTDPALLRRILFHVLGNAFKFTERGEVRVEATRAAGEAATEIRVLDSGIGIPPDQLRRIFDLFHQGDTGHTRKYDGVGLGLTLVRTCVTLLRGRCEVRPVAGGGTRVELRLPDPAAAAGGRSAADEDAGADAVPQAHAPAAGAVRAR